MTTITVKNKRELDDLEVGVPEASAQLSRPLGFKQLNFFACWFPRLPFKPLSTTLRAVCVRFSYIFYIMSG